MAAFGPHAAREIRPLPLVHHAATLTQQGGDALVQSLSVVPDGGRADVLVDVDPSVDIQDFTLDSPHRIVLDIKGATLTKPAPSYDRVARGGIVNVRIAQYRTDIVRVVVEVDQAYSYDIKRDAHNLRIAVHGSSDKFVAWHSTPAADASGVASNDTNNDVAEQTVDNTSVQHPAPADVTSTNVTRTERESTSTHTTLTPAYQQSTQPRITVTYQDADIRDVIAAFATFAGRTIVVGKDVNGTVSAEIRNQPWDVALRAILQGQGLAASEDPSSGIITVDSYANIQAKQALEPLVTQLIPINYAKADSLVPVVTKLLYKDCSAVTSGAAGQPATPGTNCITRGAVAANPGTNTLIVTETPSRIDDIIRYVKKLDVRTPQVAIKAKIIFVNRTDIENLGLSYDLGSRNQFFSQLVKRVDPSTLKPVDTNGDGVPDALGGGTPYTGDRIALGGNTLSAIANANDRVTSPALSLVYSAALGKFSLTSFLDALQEVRLADLQAEPSIVTVDNREAQIQVGQDIPVRVLDANTATLGGESNGNAVPRATVSFKPVGIILKVTPHITNNHQILLDVHAENSDAQIASSDVGYVFNKQSADNRLLVRDGETAVIGGLTVTQVSQSKSGIPLLVDLPVIGKLFGTTSKSEEKRDLLILITPHVVDDGDVASAPSGR
jgi:type IV pilus assembly protein PilQ